MPQGKILLSYKSGAALRNKFQILRFGEILLMSLVNYNAMSDAELKQYFLKHRGDETAFQAYLDFH
ncbi:MAG: hypothetical protein WBA41_17125 [Rivularia sp. (in: cyanobacteria)]